MFLINEQTGALKTSKIELTHYIEISEEQYNKLSCIRQAERVMELEKMLGPLPDLDVNKLTANEVKVPGVNINKDGVNSEEGINGKNKAGNTTVTIDSETGDANFAGKITATDASFKNKPDIPDAKGNLSKAASMADVAEAAKGGIQHIASKDGTLAVDDTDKSNTIIDVNPASTTRRGAVKPGAGFTVLPDGTLKIQVASDVVIGGVLVKGGGTGIDITPEGVIYLDGAISPFLYMGTWSAKTNTPQISDKTGKPDSFYLCLEGGEIDLGSGKIQFNIGDWALCEEEEGKAGTQKYVNVPMSKAMVVTASQIKAGTLGKGIAMDTDLQIKTTANIIASVLEAATVNISGKITAQSLEVAETIIAKNINIIGGKLTFQKSN